MARTGIELSTIRAEFKYRNNNNKHITIYDIILNDSSAIYRQHFNRLQLLYLHYFGRRVSVKNNKYSEGVIRIMFYELLKC